MDTYQFTDYEMDFWDWQDQLLRLVNITCEWERSIALKRFIVDNFEALPLEIIAMGQSFLRDAQDLIEAIEYGR